LKVKNDKHGGFTCFISIIMTSVIVLMTVLMNASSIRSDEALLTGLMIQQQDLVLSGYSEKLLDWYGIYATTLPSDCADIFMASSEHIDPLTAYTCEGVSTLVPGKDFKEAILEFARPRVPMQWTMQLISRFTQINEIIQSKNTDYGENTKEEESIPEDSQDESTSGKGFDFSFIMNILGMIDQTLFEQSTSSETTESFTWENFEELLKSDSDNPSFKMDVSKEMGSNLTVTETNINDISSFLDQFYRIESNGLYDKLCFEFYVSSMFSCKTNTMICNDIEIQRKDLRNRLVSKLPVHDKLEIEKIIFGNEDSETNDFNTKISIESIRFLIHLLANLMDESKKAGNAAIAASLCAVVALATAGTVVIPEEIMEIVVVLLKSMGSAAKDYTDLSEGKGVPLLPVEKYKIMDTYYTDYLQIFLFTVPEEVKMNRIMSIMRENLFLSTIPLYTGVRVSVNYRGIVYAVEGRYDGYGTGQDG
jgi:hypothetical protein